MTIEFLNKPYFVLILFIPVLMYLFYKKQKNGIKFIFMQELKSVFKNNSYLFYIKLALLFLIFINFILLFANPNISNSKENIKKNGIDIVLALDISESMNATDLQPNRIESAKKVINQFIGKIKTDRLGLVVFAGKPFTSIPLTFDYNILTETINRLQTSNINQNVSGLNGTAIGDAILMAKTLFKGSPPPNLPLAGEGKVPNKDNEEKREKIMILLTDGDANTGVDPILAGLSAKKDGIKIYTIGIGSQSGGILTYNVGPFKQQQKVPPLKEDNLKQIATDTSGKYFRADNNDTFEKIFNEISKLEKSDINVEVKKEYKEYYNIFLLILAILLGIFTFIMIYKTEIGKD